MAIKPAHYPSIREDFSEGRTVTMCYAEHEVTLPVEVFEEKRDVMELINLGMEKKHQIEKSVREAVKEHEKESLVHRPADFFSGWRIDEQYAQCFAEEDGKALLKERKEEKSE